MRYFLELCLQSVEAAILDLDAEIIVVDNLSADASCDMVKQKFPKIKLIENKENFGFSKGNNIGVAQAKGDYLCILNPDTVVAENTFQDILNFAETKKNVGIVGCRLIDGNGFYLPESKRNVPTPKVAIQKILGQTKTYYANQIAENKTGKASVFVGAFMMLKRSVYNKVSGFDEDYFMYGEDIDLSYKVEKSGFQNYYYGLSTIIHYKGESTLKDKTYAKRFYGAMQIFYKKHFKQNFIFDAFVFIGIKSAKLVSGKTSVDTKLNSKYILVSDKNYKDLKQKLVHLEQLETLSEAQQNVEYILDANYLSYERIITLIGTVEKNKGITFKILPKNSNFIIGSNSSKRRGEIITF